MRRNASAEQLQALQADVIRAQKCQLELSDSIVAYELQYDEVVRYEYVHSTTWAKVRTCHLACVKLRRQCPDNHIIYICNSNSDDRRNQAIQPVRDQITLGTRQAQLAWWTRLTESSCRISQGWACRECSSCGARGDARSGGSEVGGSGEGMPYEQNTFRPSLYDVNFSIIIT